MNGILIRALLVALITASPIAVATAQETPKAEEEKKVDPAQDPAKAEEPKKDDEQKKTEEEEKKAEETPAEQPQPAEQPADQPKEEPKPAEQPAAEQPKEEPKPAAPPTEVPAAAPADAPAAAPIEKTSPRDTSSAGDETVAGPQVTATAESTPDAAAAKAWRISADLTFSLGSAFALKNEDIRKPSFGWAFDTTGAYTLTKLLDGNLDVFGRITMDQVLANTTSESAVGQSKQYEFFFRDIRLGLTAPGLYKEKVTGITISPSTEFFLPTSKTTIAARRWLQWGINLRLGRTFEKLGPGDLGLALGSSFRKSFSGRHTNPEPQIENSDGTQVDVSNLCRSYVESDVPELPQLQRSACGSTRNSNFSFISDVGVNYTWGPVTAALSIALYNIRYYRGDLGPDPTGLDVGESPYASDNTWVNLTLSALSVSYAINDNFTLGLALTTYQSPYWYRNGNNSSLRPPFWDSKGENYTTLDLGVTFVY